MKPRMHRLLLLFSVASLLLFSIGGAYVLEDVRVLLLLVPPSLTYFLIDAFRDAKHQSQLLAELEKKKEARQAPAAEAEASGRKTPGKRAKGGKGRD
jgi:hypothetical protein